MRGRVRRIVLSTILPAVAGTLVVAAEGRIPIWQPATTILEPGHYVVTRDLAAGPGETVITVRVSDVEIDLNGFTLRGSDTSVVRSDNADNVTIRNGGITSGTDAVLIESFRRVVIEDLRIDVPAGNAIVLNGGTGFAVRRNQIEAAGDTAIVVNGIPDTGSHGLIEDNLIHHCLSGITLLEGFSVSIRRNRLHDFAPGGAGIALQGSKSCLVLDNVVESAGGGTGIRLDDSQGCKLARNTVRGWAQHGMFLMNASDGNLVADNVVRGCGECGILVDGRRNHFERNLLVDNSEYGLKFTSLQPFGQNTYGRNTARGNGPGGTCTGPSTAEWCDDGVGNTSRGDNLMPDLM